ncbi:variant erythrocyte surface antigen-1 family protein [Babesia caballi]|uniref:Variant erythrocyte surface antigen-1 family protein n=1 Tax=Babesia caballi TaxID=5871 RepID=A0AAV4LS93_BABCB|nr:variant erythrocyte surface antigen-1 family protein [Babesia caballi]
MGAPKTQLTDWPEDLKEAIDWLAAVGGGFGGIAQKGWSSGKFTELETALMQLSDFEKSKEKIFGKSQLQGAIRGLANGLGYGFLGYQVQRGYEFSQDGIINKEGGNYKSTYDGAPWPQDSTELQQCALIFLGSAYVTYYFVTFLYWACSNKYSGPWKGLPLQDDQRPGKYLKAMGFTSTQLNGEKHGTQIAELLDSDYNGFTELNVSGPSYYSSYNYFQYLEKLNQKHKHVDWNYPLIGCYLLSHHYFSLKSENTDVKNAMDSIKKQFEKLRGYSKDDYSTLKQSIRIFLSKVTTFTPSTIATPSPQQPPSGGFNTSQDPSPSPAGPVAGTLTTLGLGGGAVAVYLLDLGGAKTLVNGILKIN